MKQDLKFTRAIRILIIAAAILLVYHHIIHAPFLWDDEVMITGNPSVQGTLDLTTIFTSGAFGGSLKSSSFYRPVQILTYNLDYRIWGFNPTGFHLTNLLLHLASCIFLMLFLLKTGLKEKFAFMIGLVFALHPIHIENVTYLSGRGDLLCTFFAILSLYLLILSVNSNRRWIWGILALLSYVFSLFSKENNILLPVLLLFLFYWKKEFFFSRKKFIVSITGLFIIVMAGYILFRYFLLMQLETKSLSLISDASLPARLCTLPATLMLYLRLLLVPFHYHMEYHFVIDTPWNIYLLLLILVCVALYVIFRFKMIGLKEGIFYIAWFVIFLIPALNIIYPLAATAREHWVSLSSAGMFLFIGSILQHQSVNRIKIKKIKIFPVIAALWILYMGAYTYERNNDWKDPFRLYFTDVQHSPDSFILWNNLGVEYFRSKDLPNAKRCFEKSIIVCPPPGYAPSCNNLGVIMQNNGKLDSALLLFNKAIQLQDYLLAYQNLGRQLMFQQQYQNAVNVLTQGRQHHPNDPELLYYLGLSYYYLHDFNKAEQVLSLLNKFYPSYKETRNILLNIRQNRGE